MSETRRYDAAVLSGSPATGASRKPYVILTDGDKPQTWTRDNPETRLRERPRWFYYHPRCWGRRMGVGLARTEAIQTGA